jgi:branched-chain amino acid aminotransferase
MSTVFLNGEFTDSSSARIGAFDSGLQHGVGIFETMLAIRDGAGDDGVRVVHMHEHLARMADSARQLGLTSSLRTAALAEAVVRTVAREALRQREMDRFRVRLTITAGDMNMLRTPAQGEGGGALHDPLLMIHAQPAQRYPDEMFERGVMVALADWKANPLDQFQGHKTLNYWPRLRELQIAAGKRAGEALIMQVTNHVCGGCVSNICIIKNNTLITPMARGEEQTREAPGGSDPSKGPTSATAVVPSPVLPGVTRRWALDCAQDLGLAVERRLVTISDVLDADEVFLTNSGWGVLPVVAVEARQINTGLVGNITKSLVDRWANV